MRRLLLILLVLLLPLRVLAAQAMVVQMAGQEVAAAVAAQAGDTQASAAAMPADCPMMLAKASPDASHSTHGVVCQTCQLCMALASVPVPPAHAGPAYAQAPPVLGATRFASAELARLAEPPIR